MKKLIPFILCCMSTIHLSGQIEHSSDLYKKLKTLDSLLFNIGYSQCDMKQFQNILSEDFEFYHDKGGSFNSKAAFIKSIDEGLCNPSPYKHRRELLEGSLEVYSMEKSGVLYGAVQMGVHRFFESKNNGPEHLGSTAKFTHLWLLENGEWKLSRVLSYDHQVKDGKH
ncbi:MAG TPA: nuclear transport factor 2 family protein [Bacteroidia bacterium]|nr:nuclear transport factor 2 family protein [Bacteroidia bacterium]